MGQLACLSHMPLCSFHRLKAYMCTPTHHAEQAGIIHAGDDASGAAAQEQATAEGAAESTAAVKAAEGVLPCKH